jgi:hypothetical protein
MERHRHPIIGFRDVIADQSLPQIDVRPLQPKHITYPPTLRKQEDEQEFQLAVGRRD